MAGARPLSLTLSTRLASTSMFTSSLWTVDLLLARLYQTWRQLLSDLDPLDILFSQDLVIVHQACIS